jgi:mannosyltransferase|tara:strand:+ start:20566 stop:21579 length:1014 start_codon:yes stop_codon:yes gene_type:complete
MLYLDGIIFSIQKFGGISTYFSELYNGLNKYKFENELILYDKNPNFLNNSNLKLSNKRFFERYKNLKNIPSGSIVHSSYYRTSNQINVITVYDFTYEKFSKRILDNIHIAQKRNAIKNSDIIICISENTKSDLLHYYPESTNKKIFVTHLAASKNYFNKELSYNSRISKPYILFVGNRASYKNFIQLVKSMKNFPDLSLYVAGGGDFSKEERFILEKNCKNRYKHFKNFDNNKLNDLYNSAISLVYPSLYEGFGIPVIEAMSAGCPVIASNCSSITEIATGSAILLKESNDVNITEAINKILIEKNFNFYQKEGLKNSLNFSWDITVKKTIKCYNEI